MFTLETLREFGADTAKGMERCMNNEAFYLRLVRMAAEEPGFEKLRAAVEGGDLASAFEAAHALKGVLGNLSLTPLYELTSEMTELLRAGADADYGARLEEILRRRAQLRSLWEE